MAAARDRDALSHMDFFEAVCWLGARVAEALRREPGVQVQVVDGNRGEFTVSVDGQTVAQKGEKLPDVAEVVAAVKNAGAAKVG